MEIVDKWIPVVFLRVVLSVICLAVVRCRAEAGRNHAFNKWGSEFRWERTAPWIIVGVHAVVHYALLMVFFFALRN
jgi:hypothetical protein